MAYLESLLSERRKPRCHGCDDTTTPVTLTERLALCPACHRLMLRTCANESAQFRPLTFIHDEGGLVVALTYDRRAKAEEAGAA